MCGIAGVLSTNGYQLNENDTGRLNRMLGCMYHRGPDGEGKKIFSSCQFGMRRLAIIDIGGGQQPISNETEDVWVIMNGEIYNYIELRDELMKKCHFFKTHSDTEVVVHLYEEYGEDFVSRINGMFAIYLYDKKNERKILYRDSMGIKPLFYSVFEGKLFFSSDLTGLASVVNAKLSRDAIISFLGLSYIPKPASIYEGVYKLMPGCCISISEKNELKVYQYWKINRNKVNKDISFDEAKIRLHELLIDSNSIQLRSDADFAISLSGGIDSSIVLAYASLSYGKKLNTISMGYEGKIFSQDVMYAEAMAKKYNTNHILIDLKKSQFVEHLDELMPYIDEPISDSALIPNYIISKEASRRGIKVLLSGAGGDELFKGYSRYFKPSYGSARGLIRYPKHLRNLGYYFLQLFGSNNNIDRLLYHELAFASDINGLNFTFLRRIANRECFKNISKRVTDHYHDLSMRPIDFSKSRMLNDTSNYLVDNILSLSDKATMAASVEGRFPLLDTRIVDFAFSLPGPIICNNSEAKGFLKQVIKPYIPKEILYRPKEGFNAPIEQWFGDGQIKKIKKYIIDSSEKNLGDIIDINSLERTFVENDKGSKNFENIYNLYFLNKWIDQHV